MALRGRRIENFLKLWYLAGKALEIWICLRVQVHPEELWVSKQRLHIVLEASKSAGAKGDVPKICGFVHPL